MLHFGNRRVYAILKQSCFASVVKVHPVGGVSGIVSRVSRLSILRLWSVQFASLHNCRSFVFSFRVVNVQIVPFYHYLFSMSRVNVTFVH
jgi:hypothetical protein